MSEDFEIKNKKVKIPTSTSSSSQSLPFDTATKGDLKNLKEQLKKDFEGLMQKKTDEFDKKIEEKQERVLEILAIFITLFTFISVHITIFQQVKDLITASIFMLLMTLCACFLLSFILLAVRREIPKSNKITTWGLILSLVGLILTILLALKLNLPLNLIK